MIDKTLAELKAIATELGITPEGDKRLKDTWIRAIHAKGITVVEPWFDKEKSPLEREQEKLPLGARVALLCKPTPQPPEPETEPEPEKAEEPFVPKFHQIYVTEAGIIRYRYRHESYKSEWIRWCDSLDELCNSLREIEASLEGTCTYKNHKIQVTPLLEINYKPPSGDWLKFPLEADEDIQEGLTRLHNAIDNSFPSFIDKLPDDYAPFSTIFKQVIYATIPQSDLVEFRRNCQPIAASPRPP